MAFLAVHLDDDSELGIGEVHSCNELVTVVDLVLRNGLREASTSYQLTEPGFENAANGAFTRSLPFEHSAHDPSAWTKLTAELLPSTPNTRCRVPATPKPVVEQFLETVDSVHETEVEDGPERASDRDAVDFRHVTVIQVLRLVPDDVAPVPPSVPQCRYLDDLLVAVHKAPERGR